MKTNTLLTITLAYACGTSTEAFQTSSTRAIISIPSAATTTSLFGLFDKFSAGGSGKDRLDEEWEKQQEILRFRRSSTEDRAKYFEKVEERRAEASREQKEKWAWQTKQYKKGEDPIDEWKKRRANGQISDLNDQYGDEKKKGGIPLPMASFGVGGEFGVGGKFDNGGRFDLRLPYAEQGYVDEDSDLGAKISSFFTGKKKDMTQEKKVAPPSPVKSEPPKKKNWFGQ